MNKITTIIAVFAACTVHAQCVAPDATGTAQWIFNNQRNFFAGDVTMPERYLSAKLFLLLKAEWKCVSDGELCAIDADPWTRAQDGNALPPIKYVLASGSSTVVSINMSYLFGWRDASTPKPVLSTTRIKLSRTNTKSCWLLDDIIGPDGQSLAKQLTQ